MRFAAWAAAGLVFFSTPAFAQEKPLELTLEGRRDWNLNGLFGTKKGAFAGYAALAGGFLAMGNAKMSGTAWQTDKITVILQPDGKGGFSGTGKWSAVSLSPSGTFPSSGLPVVKTPQPVTINGLTLPLKGTVNKGQMVLPIDAAQQGKVGANGQKTAYVHLNVTVDWRDGMQKVIAGRDEYGMYRYTARVRRASSMPAPVAATARLGDVELCTASIQKSFSKLTKAGVTTQCGCFIPKFRGSLAAKDFEGWRRMMEISLEPGPATQRGGNILNHMSQMGPPWVDRVSNADRAAQETCKITNWN